MVNKFKTLLKKEKGFTLVELLAVIVILGIIVAIAIPAIGSIIDNAEEGATKAEIQLVTDAARLYDIQEGIVNDTTTVQNLIDAGYLDVRADDLIVPLDTDVKKDDATGEISIDYSYITP